MSVGITIPSGDPGVVASAARHLNNTASGLIDNAKQLDIANKQATQAWDGRAQHMFTLLAGGFVDIIEGTADIAGQAAVALTKYSNTLHHAQTQAYQARQQLNALISATPPGMIPDPTALAHIKNQAAQAVSDATVAAHELTATATALMGSPQHVEIQHSGGDVNASFVSRIHSFNGDMVSTAAANFDAQAAQISQQLRGVLTGLSGLAGPNVVGSGLYPSSTIVGGSDFSSSISAQSILGGTSVIGGSSFSSSISAQPVLGGAATIGGYRPPEFQLIGGSPVPSGPAIIGGGVYEHSSPRFRPSAQSGNLPLNLPANHPVIRDIVNSGVTMQLMNRLDRVEARNNRANSAMLFDTPYDPTTPRGIPGSYA